MAAAAGFTVVLTAGADAAAALGFVADAAAAASLAAFDLPTRPVARSFSLRAISS